jgi:hypothetical protein
MEEKIEEFWDLVEEALDSILYETIFKLKKKGAPESEIRAELRRLHGLDTAQARRILREYEGRMHGL